MISNADLVKDYIMHISSASYPCIAARASIQKNSARYFVADHLGCPKDDRAILDFLHSCVDEYRAQKADYFSASILFKQPELLSEEEFDMLLWQRLQAFSDLDRLKYAHDPRVSNDPASDNFCYSIKEEGFFIVGMNPGSKRESRKFKSPVLVFNPHAQFEQLRESQAYAKMQAIVRKNDLGFSGSVNPMLKDFGCESEVYQYSGRAYDKNWQCPLKKNNG